MKTVNKKVLTVSLPLMVVGLLVWLYFLNLNVPIPGIVIVTNSTSLTVSPPCSLLHGTGGQAYFCPVQDLNPLIQLISFVGFCLFIGFSVLSVVMLFDSIPAVGGGEISRGREQVQEAGRGKATRSVAVMSGSTDAADLSIPAGGFPEAVA